MAEGTGINRQSPIDVRILYDNSGSMYPGYRLEGGARRNRAKVAFFYEYPEFREWLSRLVKEQSKFNADTVSLSVFTESEITQILPSSNSYIDTGTKDIANAFESLRGPNGMYVWGKYTSLTENLEAITKDFNGVLWLITDNIIVTREVKPDTQDILNFFKALNHNSKYRSVHLYKYPFRDVEKGQKSNLAIYGILVSSKEVDQKAISYFDENFIQMKQLFPSHEHLKLKDLSINPVSLEAPARVEIISASESLLEENQVLRIHVRGKIQSNLTQSDTTFYNRCQL